MAHDNPSRLVDLTADRLSHFQAKSRERGLVESTIKGDLAHLKAALRWAERVGLLVKVPKIEMPKRAKSAKMMKGRPITTEEFERMLAKVSGVVGEADAEVWKYYLNGLWRSGLRLSESLELFWDNDNKLCVDLSGKHPMLRIPGELEKGNKDRLLPLAPEFAEFLLTTPEAERTDRVFNLTTQAARAEMPSGWWVSRNVCKIGEAAGVKVSTNPRNGKVKFASAHDLRRSFGERWSTRIIRKLRKWSGPGLNRRHMDFQAR